MEPVLGHGALLQPGERTRQRLAEGGDGEVFGAQQVVDHGVVGGDPRRPATHQPTAGAEFVGETAGVRAHGGVGDEPALHLTVFGAERRQPADDPVQSEPVCALTQRHDVSLSSGRRSSKRSNKCQTYDDDPSNWSNGTPSRRSTATATIRASRSCTRTGRSY